MKWAEIRDHFVRLHAFAKVAGVTQQAVASRGGIAGQNSVSRLIRNMKRGPTVEIFVSAVEGLGLTLVEFFETLESNSVPVSWLEEQGSAAQLKAWRNAAIHHQPVDSLVSRSAPEDRHPPPQTTKRGRANVRRPIRTAPLVDEKLKEELDQLFRTMFAEHFESLFRRISKNDPRDGTAAARPSAARTSGRRRHS